jgi:hypothetical protein
MQVGGLVGGTMGGGLSALGKGGIRAAFTKAGMRRVAAAVGVDAVGAGIGGAAGYARTGTFDGTMMGVNAGIMASNLGIGGYNILKNRRAMRRMAGGTKSVIPNFGQFKPGQGFSGVFDPKTGTLRIKPSTSAADLPEGFVRRRGGHGALRRELQAEGIDTGELQGFTAFLDDAGNLRLEYFSRSVNRANPKFPGETIPPELQGPIRDAIRRATGRGVE